MNLIYKLKYLYYIKRYRFNKGILAIYIYEFYY